MSVKCVDSASPQIYSRLFRPWDGKTHQDNTISSTTTQRNQLPPPRSTNIEVTDEKIECCKIVKKPIDAIKIKSESDLVQNEYNQMFPIDNNLISNFQTKFEPNQLSPVTRVPPVTGYFPSVPLFRPQPLPTASYHDLFMPNLPLMTSISMEQECARILAEDAQVKMMTARKQRPKKFKCPHCDVAFSNNGQLKGHIRIHTGKHLLEKFDSYFLIILNWQIDCSKNA